MMYVSCIDDKEINYSYLCVALEKDFLLTLYDISEQTSKCNFPYPVSMDFEFPNDKVRLIDKGDRIDDCIEDQHEYEDWQKGSEDPLEYYRFHIHNYVPKEEYWYCKKPEHVKLCFYSNAIAFQAFEKDKIHYGYGLCLDDWSKKLS